jgi:hypothetical protein
MPQAFFLIACAAAIVLLLVMRIRRARGKTLVIEQPRWGLANFLGSEGQHQIQEDTSSMAPILGSPLRADLEVPKCEVLFIYVRVRSDGTLENSSRGLRELIRDSGAVVVVVASENAGEAYIAAGGRKSYGDANLVMTLRRNGEGFSRFFADLFSRMRAGVSMSVAWVELAPQHSGLQPGSLPETIFACEVGQVALGRRLPNKALQLTSLSRRLRRRSGARS